MVPARKREMPSLLEIRNLRTYFACDAGLVRAVDGVDLTLEVGKTLGIVGESGCGKTVLALSIMRLVPHPPGRTVSGEIVFGGTDLLRLKKDEMRRIRGKDISMIFQEPMTSLNPVFRVGDQIAETFRFRQDVSRREAAHHAVEMLRLVGIPAPEKRALDYPHQMSGGMRQRVMIAIALSCHPRLMLADEPTTALDVTIQAQILDLIARMKEKIGMAMVMITHDLGVIAETAEDVAVMYAGRIVEYGSATAIFAEPCHPYTRCLMASIPQIDGTGDVQPIPGSMPNLTEIPRGCGFADRCPEALPTCYEEESSLREHSDGHYVRCWK